jgi:hypothetical protein
VVTIANPIVSWRAAIITDWFGGGRLDRAYHATRYDHTFGMPILRAMRFLTRYRADEAMCI